MIYSIFVDAHSKVSEIDTACTLATTSIPNSSESVLNVQHLMNCTCTDGVFSIKWITIIQFSGELYWFLYWNLVQLLPSYTGNIWAHFIQVNQICFFMFICMSINTDSFRICTEFILNHWFEFYLLKKIPRYQLFSLFLKIWIIKIILGSKFFR